MSKNQEFADFWGSLQGQQTVHYIESACEPDHNDIFAQHLLSAIYEEDRNSLHDIRAYLLNCQRSIQRILATI